MSDEGDTGAAALERTHLARLLASLSQQATARSLPETQQLLLAHRRALLAPLSRAVPYPSVDSNAGAKISVDTRDARRQYRREALDAAESAVKRAQAGPSGAKRSETSTATTSAAHAEMASVVENFRMSADAVAGALRLAQDVRVPATEAALAIYAAHQVRDLYPGCTVVQVASIVMSSERRSTLNSILSLLDIRESGASEEVRDVLQSFVDELVADGLFANLQRLLLALDDLLEETFHVSLDELEKFVRRSADGGSRPTVSAPAEPGGGALNPEDDTPPSINWDLVNDLVVERRITAECIFSVCRYLRVSGTDVLPMLTLVRSSIGVLHDSDRFADSLSAGEGVKKSSSSRGGHQSDLSDLENRVLGRAAAQKHRLQICAVDNQGMQVINVLLLAICQVLDTERGVVDSSTGEFCSSDELKDDSEFIRRFDHELRNSRAWVDAGRKTSVVQPAGLITSGDMPRRSGGEREARGDEHKLGERVAAVIALRWLVFLADTGTTDVEDTHLLLNATLAASPLQFLADHVCLHQTGGSERRSSSDAEAFASHHAGAVVGTSDHFNGILHSLLVGILEREPDLSSHFAEIGEHTVPLLNLISVLYRFDDGAIDFWQCTRCERCRCCSNLRCQCSDSGNDTAPETGRNFDQPLDRNLSVLIEADDVPSHTRLRTLDVVPIVAAHLHVAPMLNIPFVRALSALASRSALCARHAYNFLRDTKRHHVAISWPHFFVVMQQIASDFNPALIEERRRNLEQQILRRQQQQYESNIYSSVRGRGLSGLDYAGARLAERDAEDARLRQELEMLKGDHQMNPDDVIGLESVLNLMTDIFIAYPLASFRLARDLSGQIAQHKSTDVAVAAHPVELLLSLAACAVPESVKRSLIVCVSSMINEVSSTELVPRVLLMLDKMGFVPVVRPQPHRSPGETFGSQGGSEFAFGGFVGNIQRPPPSPTSVPWYPMVLANGGLRAQLENVEARTGTYPVTRAFIDLLNTMITFGEPWVLASAADAVSGVDMSDPVSTGLFADTYGMQEETKGSPSAVAIAEIIARSAPHAPFSRYLTFVLDDILGPLATRRYQDTAEMWELASAVLNLVRNVIDAYEIPDGDFRMPDRKHRIEVETAEKDVAELSDAQMPYSAVLASTKSIGFQLLIEILGGSTARKVSRGDVSSQERSGKSQLAGFRADGYDSNAIPLLNVLLWICEQGHAAALAFPTDVSAQMLFDRTADCVEVALSVLLCVTRVDEAFIEKVRTGTAPFVLQPLHLLLLQVQPRSFVSLAKFASWSEHHVELIARSGVVSSSVRLLHEFSRRPQSRLAQVLARDPGELDMIRAALWHVLVDVDDGDLYSTSMVYALEKTRAVMNSVDNVGSTVRVQESLVVQASGVAEDAHASDVFGRVMRFRRQEATESRAPTHQSHFDVPPPSSVPFTPSASWSVGAAADRISVRMTVIQMLLNGLRQSTDGNGVLHGLPSDNFSLLLLDIEGLAAPPRQRRRFRATGGVVFRAVLSLLADSWACTQSHPVLAAAAYELLFLLATHSATSRVVLRYLNNCDWFVRQLLLHQEDPSSLDPAVLGFGSQMTAETQASEIPPHSAEYSMAAAVLLQRSWLMKLVALELKLLTSPDQRNRLLAVLFDTPTLHPEEDSSALHVEQLPAFDLSDPASLMIFKLLDLSDVVVPDKPLPTLHEYAAGVLAREVSLESVEERADDHDSEEPATIHDIMARLGLAGANPFMAFEVVSMDRALVKNDVIVEARTLFADIDAAIRLLQRIVADTRERQGPDLARRCQAVIAACRAHNARVVLQSALGCALSSWRGLLEVIVRGSSFNFIRLSATRDSAMWALLEHLLTRLSPRELESSRTSVSLANDVAGAALAIIARVQEDRKQPDESLLNTASNAPSGQLLKIARLVIFNGIVANSDSRLSGVTADSSAGTFVSGLSVAVAAVSTRGLLYAALINVLHLLLGLNASTETEQVLPPWMALPQDISMFVRGAGVGDALAGLLRDAGEQLVRIIAADATSSHVPDRWRCAALAVLEALLPLDDRGSIVRTLAQGGYMVAIVDSLRSLLEDEGADVSSNYSIEAMLRTGSSAYFVFRSQLALLTGVTNFKQGGVHGGRVLLDTSIGNALEACMTVAEAAGAHHSAAAGDALLVLQRGLGGQHEQATARAHVETMTRFHGILHPVLRLMCALQVASPLDGQLQQALLRVVIGSWELFGTILKDRVSVITLGSLDALCYATGIVAHFARTSSRASVASGAADMTDEMLGPRADKIKQYCLHLLEKYGGSAGGRADWIRRVHPLTQTEQRNCTTFVRPAGLAFQTGSMLPSDDYMTKPSLFRHQVEGTVAQMLRHVLLFLRTIVDQSALDSEQENEDNATPVQVLFEPQISVSRPAVLSARRRGNIGVFPHAPSMGILISLIRKRIDVFVALQRDLSTARQQQQVSSTWQHPSSSKSAKRSWYEAQSLATPNVVRSSDAAEFAQYVYTLDRDMVISWQMIELIFYLFFRHLHFYLNADAAKRAPMKVLEALHSSAAGVLGVTDAPSRSRATESGGNLLAEILALQPPSSGSLEFLDAIARATRELLLEDL